MTPGPVFKMKGHHMNIESKGPIKDYISNLLEDFKDVIHSPFGSSDQPQQAVTLVETSRFTHEETLREVSAPGLERRVASSLWCSPLADKVEEAPVNECNATTPERELS